MTQTGKQSDKLVERIDALEIRVAYQDDTIEKLNAAITEQWSQIDALQRQLALVNERLDETSVAAGDALAERPPHY